MAEKEGSGALEGLKIFENKVGLPVVQQLHVRQCHRQLVHIYAQAARV